MDGYVQQYSTKCVQLPMVDNDDEDVVTLFNTNHTLTKVSNKLEDGYLLILQESGLLS